MTIARPHLPPRAAALLNEFESPVVLGASRQLAIAADLLLALVEEHEGDADALVVRVREAAAYLSAERGESSQAIPNALRLMVDGLDAAPERGEDAVRAALAGRISRVATDLRDQVRRVVEYGAALVADCQRILVYDYSSSVAAILVEADRHGQQPAVLIPEARPLDGGKRYAEALAATDLALEAIPDAAIAPRLRGCDVALLGAETIAADGTCFNTTGSLLVAIAAAYWRVPVYAVSTLIKIDARTLFGHRRPIPGLAEPHRSRLVAALGGERVTVSCPDLDAVPPALLAGYVTEVGVLPPAAIAAHAEKFARSQE